MSAGSEPVAEIGSAAGDCAAFGERALYPLVDIDRFDYGTMLYTHPSPPEGMAGWTKASEQLPPCRDEREERKPNYLKELAICRDVFDTPPPEGKLEAVWVAAMVSPEAVPSYVEACRQDYIDKLDAKDEEIRVLSAKIVDQQKHIS